MDILSKLSPLLPLQWVFYAPVLEGTFYAWIKYILLSKKTGNWESSKNINGIPLCDKNSSSFWPNFTQKFHNLRVEGSMVTVDFDDVDFCYSRRMRFYPMK